MKNSKVTVIALLMGLNNAEVLNLQQQTDSGLITEQEALNAIQTRTQATAQISLSTDEQEYLDLDSELMNERNRNYFASNRLYPTKEEYNIQMEYDQANFDNDDEQYDQDLLLAEEQDTALEDDISLLEEEIQDDLSQLDEQDDEAAQSSDSDARDDADLELEAEIEADSTDDDEDLQLNNENDVNPQDYEDLDKQLGQIKVEELEESESESDAEDYDGDVTTVMLSQDQDEDDEVLLNTDSASDKKDGSKERHLSQKNFLKSCKDEGLCEEACEAKQKVHSLQLKNDQLTKANVESHKKVMSMLKAMKGLKGDSLTEAREEIAPFRKKDQRAFQKKQANIQKWKQAKVQFQIARKNCPVSSKEEPSLKKKKTSSKSSEYNGDWDPENREEWITKCSADGTSRPVCAAKYRMLKLKDKHEQAKQINSELGDQVKARWEALKGLKGTEAKAAKAALQPLREKKQKSLQNKNKILAKFKQAVEDYKRVKVGHHKISKSISNHKDLSGEIDWNQEERKEFIKTCVDGGMCHGACGAKYRMLKYKEKHEELKALNINLSKQVKSMWTTMKGLKGYELKKARLEIEPLRKKKQSMELRKKEILVKFHDAVKNYKVAIKQPCSSSSKSADTSAHKKQKAKLDIQNDAKEEISRRKSENADKEQQIKEWEKDGLTAEAIQAKLKIEELRAEYQETMNDFEVAQDKVKKAWSDIKSMTNQKQKQEAKTSLETLKKDKEQANKERLEALGKYKQAVNYYKGIENKYSKYSKKHSKEQWYDEAEWQVYSKQCEEAGTGKRMCAAKFKVDQLKDKYESLKEEWATIHKDNQESWQTLKSKSGEALRNAKHKHEISSRKEKEALKRKNRFEGLWREASHEYDNLKKAYNKKDFEKPSTLAKQKALKKEAIALKKENKAKIELEKAVTSEQKYAAQTAMKEARLEKEAAKIEYKKASIKQEQEKEVVDLDNADATDAEQEAIRKIKKYKQAKSSDSSDSDGEADQSVEKETQKMKQYFKKSKIFKKYKDERIKDQVINGEEREAYENVHYVKQKYVDLMKKYGILKDKVELQLAAADNLELSQKQSQQLLQQQTSLAQNKDKLIKETHEQKQQELYKQQHQKVQAHNQQKNNTNNTKVTGEAETKLDRKTSSDPGPAMTATGFPVPRGATAKPISQDPSQPQNQNGADKKADQGQTKTNSSDIDAHLPSQDKKKKTTAKVLVASISKKPEVQTQVPKSAVKIEKK